jgi:hypothetical protein
MILLIFIKKITMQAITILKNEVNNHRLMQIDLEELAANEDLLEEVLDIITVEMRKSEPTVSWEEVKKQLNP